MFASISSSSISIRWLPVFFLVALVAACQGQIDGAASSSPAGGEPGGPAGSPGRLPGAAGAGGTGTSITPPVPKPGDTAGPLTVRRLLAVEYDNTIADLLGDTSAPAREWATEVVGEWGYPEARAPSLKQAEEIRGAAVRVAAAAASAAKVDALLACAPNADETACVRDFIARFGRRAYRRPLTADESAALEALYTKLRGGDIALDKRGAVEHVLQAMLQSPAFLYRWDLSPGRAGGGLVALDAHSLASRLSYLLWQSMPDEALRAAADTGQLADPAVLKTQAERLLASPRARGPIKTFFANWLGLFRLRLADEALAKAMRGELERFVERVVFEGDGKLATLMTSTDGFADESLAKIYGVAGVTGTELKAVSLDANRRKGLLTRAAFLTATGDGGESVPPRRGAAIYTGLLCGALPPQPADIPEPDAPDPKVSTRERFEKHATNPCATACHKLVDPGGFALGNYDGIGAYVESEAGKPIDSSGRLPLPSGGEMVFRDGNDFLTQLAASPDFKRCFSRNWFRNVLGRADTDADEPSVGRAHTAFEKAGGGVRALVLESVVTSTFLNRSRTEGEAQP